MEARIQFDGLSPSDAAACSTCYFVLLRQVAKPKAPINNSVVDDGSGITRNEDRFIWSPAPLFVVS